MRRIPKAVRAALEHVRKFHPQVCQVFFGIDGRWRFMDEDMEAPEFHPDVDVGILEDAADAVQSLPAAYALPKTN